ncbi:MAG: hypothetical protein EOO45_06550 [Flavobacterium sp.]|nr:MAG: hypothetical protein EOO45_06550 [Flavobacterium sp.]
MAPEIVRRAEYEGKPVDMWSMGILLYALLCGCFPFRAKAYPDLYRRIARGAFAIPEELSAPVKDLLRQLLTVDVDQRITAHNAMRHPWLQTQLINAPNMDKMRQEITILISDKPADDLDEQVLSELQVFGLSRDEVIRVVLTKTHSSVGTLYYLLLDTLVNRRRAGSKRSSHTVGPSMNAPVNASTGVAMQRPMSANYAAAVTSNNVIKAIPAPMNRANGNNVLAAGGQQQGGQPAGQQGIVHYENLIQQQVAEQMAQQQLERQEYRYRPKSASQNRNIVASAQMASGGAMPVPLNAYSGQGYLQQQLPQQQQQQQRPLSAFAGRRPT